jgi:sugar phosphate isomerase/epimerase
MSGPAIDRRILLLVGGARVALGPTRHRRRVETAIATITCDGFGDEDFRYAFSLIPQLGIRNVEFNAWHARNLTPAGIESIRVRCTKAGLVPISLQVSAWVSGDGTDVTREVDRMLWVMEASRRLGCRIIKATGSGRGSRGGVEGIVRVLKHVAPAAEQQGLLICLENHHQSNLENPDDYDHVFSEIPSRAVGMCVDPAHFNAARVDLHQLVDRFAPRIFHIDLKDNAGPGKHEVVPYGEGVVDLDALVTHAIERGYRGYLVVEMARADRSVTLDELRVGRELARRHER